MTSGPTKIPPQQIPGQAPPAKPPGDPNVLLEKLPAELSDVKRTIEIKGRVIRDHGDGRLDIRTEQGDVTVKADPRPLNVRQGDEVEIQIPPGRPPQNARVTAEAQTPAPPRTTQTPVDVEVRPPPAQPVQRPESPPPAALSEGQVVRLQPLTPEEAQQYIPGPIETIAALAPEIIAAQTEIITQEAQEFIANELAKITGQVAQPAQATVIPVATPATAAPPVTVSSPAQTITTQGQPATEVLLVKPPLVPVIPGDIPSAQAAIPSLLSTLPPAPAFPVPQAPITFSPENTFPLQTPAAQIFRAQVAVINDAPSPAILTPKIPPAPVMTHEILAQTFEKPLLLQNHKAGEIPGIVAGLTPQKLPVIALFNPATNSEMFFIMHVPGGSVLPGTEIALLPQQPLQTSMPITATVTLAPMPSYFLTPEPWPLMDEIYQTLAQIMPRAAQAMSNMTPSPQNPAQLGPAALFFIAAVRGGDLTQWLGGNGVDALRRGGKAGLLGRLGQEGSALNRLASEPVANDWRAMSLPMLFDNQMHKIALYYKNDSENPQKDQKGKQTRFIFDLSLDALGKVQLDGLFRAKRLDLIVRTLTPFSLPMQQDMRRIYSGALGETSITGELSFQNSPAQWVTITPEAKSNLGISA